MAAQARLQCSLYIEAAHTITVTYPTGGVAYNIVIAAGTSYDNTDALCDDMEAQLLAAGAGVWVIASSDTGYTTSITSPGANFDWTWDSDAEVRDWLGFSGNVVNQASPWSGSRGQGILYPVNYIVMGVETQATRRRAHAFGSQAVDGSHDSAAVVMGLPKRRTLMIELERNAGAFTEFSAYRNLLEYVVDGRPFTVWPDADDLATYYTYRFVGPDRIPYERRFDRLLDRYRVMWLVEDMD